MKKAVGIIAEYNPFHNGHAYQIQKAKELSQNGYIVVIMSGDFVQRGTPAVLSKHERAKMALLGGADLVLELPSYYACSSAEFFAKGAVGILNALNTIDYLCFGSESGDIHTCLSLAKILCNEPEYYRTVLKQHLKKGISFPAARKRALLEYFKSSPDKFQDSFLDMPNNILGIEYCKALLSLNSPITPITIQRMGNAYHESKLSDSAFPSASAIRKALHQSEQRPESMKMVIADTQPAPVAEYMTLLLKTQPLLCEDDFSLLLKYCLMNHTSDTLCRYADISNDLAQRIYKNLNNFISCSRFAEDLKTKELTFTRISRGLLHALLGIPQFLPASAPSYARILGFRRESSGILREMQEKSHIPLLTKAADYKKLLPEDAIKAFEKDIYVSNLYETVKSAKKQAVFVNDLQKPPVIL